MTVHEKQNTFVFYVRVLICVLMMLVLRAVAAAPLISLLVFDGWKRALAILSPLMAVLVVLPLRYSFAQAMTREKNRFSFDAAFSFSRYGEKLKRSLLHILHVLLWGIPFAALCAGALYAYTQVDALTLFQFINELGNTCGQLLAGDGANANNFMLGVAAVGAVFGLGVLIWLWGMARNSANRYLWAIAVDTGCEPRKELRRRLKGRRMAQLGRALVNLILWIPFLLAAVLTVKNAVSDVSTMLMMAITTGDLPKLDLVAAAVPMAAAFVGLYLPILPLRRWNIAAFAMRKPRAKAEKKAQA